MTATPMTRPTALTLPDGAPAAAAWTLHPELRHLNHGSYGAVPAEVQAHQNAFRTQMEAAPVIWFGELPPKVAAARAEIARFLDVSAEKTAFVPNASGGASVVYASLPLRAGGEIVVTDHGYGAVTMGAQRLARRYGGRVRVARIPLDATPQAAHDAVVGELTEATCLIVIDHITSATARLLPVDTVSAEARRRGIPVLVDGAHVPGLYDRPLGAVDCDFWIGNLHKFACAPRGAAVLVARTDRRHDLYPLIDSWGAPLGFPDRFDIQGTLDLTSYLAAPRSIEFLERIWGWPMVRQYMSRLADYAEHLIADAFSSITREEHRVDVGSPVNALRLVRLPRGLATTHADADGLRDRVARELGVEAAFTSFNGIGYYRISVHAYNTAADFEYFAERCVPVLCAWART